MAIKIKTEVTHVVSDNIKGFLWISELEDMPGNLFVWFHDHGNHQGNSGPLYLYELSRTRTYEDFLDDGLVEGWGEAFNKHIKPNPYSPISPSARLPKETK